MVALTIEGLQTLSNEILGDAAQRRLDQGANCMQAWHESTLQSGEVFTMYDEVLQNYNRVYIALQDMIKDIERNGEDCISKASIRELRMGLTGLESTKLTSEKFRNDLKSIIKQTEERSDSKESFKWLKEKYPDVEERDLELVSEMDNKTPLRLLELAPKEMGAEIVESPASDAFSYMELVVHNATDEEQLMYDYIASGKGLSTEQARSGKWVLTDTCISVILSYLSGWENGTNY